MTMTIEEIEERISDTILASERQWAFEKEASEDSGSAYIDPGEREKFMAKAVIDVLGLEVETRVTTYPAPGSEQFDDATVEYDDVSGTFVAVMDGLDISDRYNDWFDSLPFQSRIIGRIEE